MIKPRKLMMAALFSVLAVMVAGNARLNAWYCKLSRAQRFLVSAAGIVIAALVIFKIFE